MRQVEETAPADEDNKQDAIQGSPGTRWGAPTTQGVQEQWQQWWQQWQRKQPKQQQWLRPASRFGANARARTKQWLDVAIPGGGQIGRGLEDSIKENVPSSRPPIMSMSMSTVLHRWRPWSISNAFTSKSTD
ncbi:uncharacterized protein SEPMUDRAFT_118960 [Sphaerulina musiva SO2202]|uniref:Uncharacterized protein n=1 Tax=Sphaerulina musiva (strain SO2202) TaxID=692275 RepID=N1QDX7_SPHMS|nr:uncharacterized protein SEPMUDRAFT_118960 [Sphaerulina musiva SO2202]EMF10410.1 hypothetical protein SEPMUDRAFT_118960 [Sphaerulina musiva SO2202]